tara:strand:- start:118 stop:366 length:249 start_codon:yes stop_codon:yes gene_type:complete
MTTLQILGWIYLGIMLGSMGGVFGLSLFQASRVADMKATINDLEFKNRILRGENDRLSKRGKPAKEKEEIGRKNQSKNRLIF